MEQQLRDEKPKQGQQSMNLTEEKIEKELTAGNVSSQLNAISQKTEQRKVNEKEIDFLVNEFALNRIKAGNILRKVDLATAVKQLIDA